MILTSHPSEFGPQQSLRTAWIATSILVAFHALSFMDRLIVTLLAVPIQKSFDLTDVQLGLLQGFAFAALFAIAGLPIGWLVDRYSRRFIILAGVLVWSVATVSCGLARSFYGLCFARAGVGAGEATLSPAAFSLMADLFPRDRLASAIGVYFLGANIGAALALTLGGLVISVLTDWGGLTVPLIGHLEPWQATFLVIGAPGAVMAFLILLVREPPRRPVAPPEERSGVRAGGAEFLPFLLAKRKILACHFLGFPVLALVVYAIQAWAAVYMTRRFGWSPALIGLIMGLAVGLCGGLANVIAGRIADRMVRRGILDAYFRLHVITTIIAVPVLLIAFSTATPALFVVLFCIGKGLLTSFGGPSLATLQLIAPDRLRGRLSALYLLVLAVVGTGLGPVATALLTELVLGDREMVGTSILIVVGVAAPFGATMLFLGMKHLRREMSEAEADGRSGRVAHGQ